MPETIRATGGSLQARLRRHRLRIACAGALLPLPATALADEAPSIPTIVTSYVVAFGRLEQHEIAALALILGGLFFAVVTAILLVRTRARAAADEAAARDDVAALAAEVDRLTELLLTEPQVVVSWPPNGDAPDIVGNLAAITGDNDPTTLLAFGAWLAVD